MGQSFDPLSSNANDAPVPPDSGPGGSRRPSELTGQRIGRYLVGRKLGSGGASTVYQAYDQVRGRSVALKVLLPGADEVSRSRFRQEAQTAATLRHPHIVETLQVGDSPNDGVAYIAMELVEGESLGHLLDRRGQLHPEESCNLLEPVARALAYAHNRGLVHRDVKPSNILLRPSRPGAPNSVQLEAVEYPMVPLLSDFGIARALDTPELTHIGRTIGTPAYMSPEQCEGRREIDGRSDIYSLGAVLYRCLVGRAPFTGSMTQILHAHVYEPLTVPDDVLGTLPPLVVEILRRSLAKEPAERYPNAGELANSLALAAGRSPLIETSGDEPNVTATMTLASLPVASQRMTPRTETVLVPAPTRTTTSVTPTVDRRATAAPPPDLTLQPAPVQPQSPVNRVLFALGGLVAVILLFFVISAASSVLPRLLGDDPPAPPVSLTEEPDEEETPPAVAIVSPSPTLTVTPTVEPTATETPAPTATDVPPAPGVINPTRLPPTDTPTATVEPSSTPTASATASPTVTFTPPPTATPTLRPPTPTFTPTDTPEVIALPSVVPEPTATPTATTTFERCPFEPAPGFADYLNGNPLLSSRLGCATTPAQPAAFEIQPFQRGFALWYPDENRVYVRYADFGQWEWFASDWQPGMPEIDDPNLQPPEVGLFVPTGAIGRLWAENAALREALGWATAETVTVDGEVQGFDGGVLFHRPDVGQFIDFSYAELRS